MQADGTGRGGMFKATVVLTVVALLAAFAVRGVKGKGPLAPADREREAAALREPMQFLGRSAAQRVAELDDRVDPTRRAEWKVVRRTVFELRDCPDTAAWIDSTDGQRFERALDDLRRGSRDEALAALALIVELARRSDWEPGLLARTADAERLATLLQEWLRTWGERAADDATLAEPGVAALMLYGRAMRRASKPLPLVTIDAAYERGRAFLASLLSDAQGQPTALSRAARARHPTAIDGLASKGDALAGFDAAAEQLFAGLDGECE
jgi:hypothetical protein